MGREESQVGGEGMGEGACSTNEMSVPAVPSALGSCLALSTLSGPRWDREQGFVLPGGSLQVSAGGASARAPVLLSLGILRAPPQPPVMRTPAPMQLGLLGPGACVWGAPGAGPGRVE